MQGLRVGRVCGADRVCRAPDAQHAGLLGGEGGKRLRNDGVDDLAAIAAGSNHANIAQLAEVPRDERLGEAHALDQLGHRGRAIREQPQDPQPVHIGKDLVEVPQLAQVVGLVHDVGEGAAEPCGGGRHEVAGLLAGGSI